jgi:hypothetical protein
MSSLGKGNSNFVEIKGHVLFKKEIITTLQKLDGVIFFKSQKITGPENLNFIKVF